MMSHQDLGRQVINSFVEGLSDVATVESPVRLDGRIMFAVIAPKKEEK